MIAAFAEATISFTFPGLFYIISSKKAQKKLSWQQTLGAYSFSMFGLLFFFVSNYFNILKLLKVRSH